MHLDEFYIGWLNKPPQGVRDFLRKYILMMLAIIIALGLCLSLGQKKFSKSNFEYGQLTEIKGVYFSKPVPCIRVSNSKDMAGFASYLTIPLVGYGKHGAGGIISAWERENHLLLDRKEITLTGTLIYYDGKSILQIDPNDKPFLDLSAHEISADLFPDTRDLGIMEIKGEIVDPKCFFGVMKPGEGKPHRDCATRCILGGIPPVLAIRDKLGFANYCLILGPNGEPINDLVKNFVAEPISVKARAVRHDDWIVLYLEGMNAIHSISRSAYYQPGEVMTCAVSQNK